MAEKPSPAAAAQLREWFRHDVEDRLEHVLGGAARLRVVVLLAAVLALDSADKATVGATAGQLESALHIGNTQLGLLVTVSSLLGALATLPAGALADRFNRVNLLTGAIVLWSAAMVISGASGSYFMLLLTRLALGGVVAIAGPAVASLTGDLFPAAERGRIYGFILAGELLGVGAGYLLSGEIAAALSWRYSFWALAGLSLLLAVAIWRLLPEPERGGGSRMQADDADDGAAPRDEGKSGSDVHSEDMGADDDVEQGIISADVRPRSGSVLHVDPARQSIWWAVRYVLTVRTNVILIVASGIGYFFFSGLRTFAVIFVTARFGTGQALATLVLVLVGGGAIIGVLTTGRIADTLISRGHVSARPLVAGVAFLIAALLFLPGLLATSLLVAAPLLFLAAAGIGGANPPLDAARLDLMPAGLWGRAEAIRTVLRSSLEAAAPLVFGFVSSELGTHTTGLGHPAGSGAVGGTGLDRTLLIMLVPLFVAGLLMFAAGRTYPRDVATAIASGRAVADTGRHSTP